MARKKGNSVLQPFEKCSKVDEIKLSRRRDLLGRTVLRLPSGIMFCSFASSSPPHKHHLDSLPIERGLITSVQLPQIFQCSSTLIRFPLKTLYLLLPHFRMRTFCHLMQSPVFSKLDGELAISSNTGQATEILHELVPKDLVPVGENKALVVIIPSLL